MQRAFPGEKDWGFYVARPSPDAGTPHWAQIQLDVSLSSLEPVLIYTRIPLQDWGIVKLAYSQLYLSPASVVPSSAWMEDKIWLLILIFIFKTVFLLPLY